MGYKDRLDLWNAAIELKDELLLMRRPVNLVATAFYVVGAHYSLDYVKECQNTFLSKLLGCEIGKHAAELSKHLAKLKKEPSMFDFSNWTLKNKRLYQLCLVVEARFIERGFIKV